MAALTLKANWILGGARGGLGKAAWPGYKMDINDNFLATPTTFHLNASASVIGNTKTLMTEDSFSAIMRVGNVVLQRRSTGDFFGKQTLCNNMSNCPKTKKKFVILLESHKREVIFVIGSSPILSILATFGRLGSKN